MKQLILCSAALLLALAALSQEEVKPRFQFSARLGAAVWLEDPRVSMLQAGIQGEYRLNKSFSVYAPVQYSHLFFLSGNSSTTATGYISTMVGPRIYFPKNFFAGVGAGYAYFPDAELSKGAFIYHPHLGIDLPKTQISIGYFNFGDSEGMPGFIDLSFAIKIGGKKKKTP